MQSSPFQGKDADPSSQSQVRPFPAHGPVRIARPDVEVGRSWLREMRNASRGSLGSRGYQATCPTLRRCHSAQPTRVLRTNAAYLHSKRPEAAYFRSRCYTRITRSYYSDPTRPFGILLSFSCVGNDRQLLYFANFQGPLLRADRPSPRNEFGSCVDAIQGSPGHARRIMGA